GTYRLELGTKEKKWGEAHATVQLLWTADPPPNFFEKNHPKVVVFIHGLCEKNYSLEDVRDYWGFEFVRATLGGHSGSLFTFAGRELTPANWVSSARTDSSDLAHFLLATDPKLPRDPRQTPPKWGQIMGMMVHRDGSKSLMEQTKHAIRQIYDLYIHHFDAG